MAAKKKVTKKIIRKKKTVPNVSKLNARTKSRKLYCELRSKLEAIARQQLAKIKGISKDDSSEESKEVVLSSLKLKKPNISNRHKALLLLHNHMVGLEVRFQRDLFELEEKYSKTFYAPLHALRKILTKKEIVKDEKKLFKELLEGCKGCFSADDETYQELQFHIKCLLLNDEALPHGTCEHFWLEVFLRSDPILRNLIQPQDEKILRYLSDVKIKEFKAKRASPLSDEIVEEKEDDLAFGFEIILDFKSNPFFTNSILTKRYVIDFQPEQREYINLSHSDVLSIDSAEECDADGEESDESHRAIRHKRKQYEMDRLLNYTGPHVVAIKGCLIDWCQLDIEEETGLFQQGVPTLSPQEENVFNNNSSPLDADLNSSMNPELSIENLTSQNIVHASICKNNRKNLNVSFNLTQNNQENNKTRKIKHENGGHELSDGLPKVVSGITSPSYKPSNVSTSSTCEFKSHPPPDFPRSNFAMLLHQNENVDVANDPYQQVNSKKLFSSNNPTKVTKKSNPLPPSTSKISPSASVPYCSSKDSTTNQISFFNFFNFYWTEASTSHNYEAVCRDYKIGSYIRDSIFPKAYLFYRRPNVKEENKDDHVFLTRPVMPDTLMPDVPMQTSYDEIDDEIPLSVTKQALRTIQSCSSIRTEIFRRNKETAVRMARSAFGKLLFDRSPYKNLPTTQNPASKLLSYSSLMSTPDLRNVPNFHHTQPEAGIQQVSKNGTFNSILENYDEVIKIEKDGQTDPMKEYPNRMVTSFKDDNSNGEEVMRISSNDYSAPNPSSSCNAGAVNRSLHSTRTNYNCDDAFKQFASPSHISNLKDQSKRNDVIFEKNRFDLSSTDEEFPIDSSRLNVLSEKRRKKDDCPFPSGGRKVARKASADFDSETEDFDSEAPPSPDPESSCTQQ